MSIENLKDHNEETGHEFHMVDVSPWPMFISFTLLILALGFVLFLHKEQKWLLYLGGISTLGIMFLWFKDIIKEAIIDKAHNTRVRRGLVWGMKLLIISELMFFVAFFWSNIYYLMFGPTELAEANIWQITKGTWPPVNIEKINPFGLPLLNTLILALSGCAVSLSHQAILENNNKLVKFGLLSAVILGFIFTILQGIEYHHLEFKFADGVYPSNMYLATGFHGLHVIIGTIFLLICYLRARKNHFTKEAHVGFESAALYWHFVDAVWVGLYIFVYLL